MRMVVTPVTFSPFAIAHWMGAAPRYFGSNDACRLMLPYFGSSSIHLGIIRPYPTTMIAAGAISFNLARNSSFCLIFSGW